MSTQKLPLRKGVGIIILNNNNHVFVGKRKDNPGTDGKCRKVELMMERIL